MTWENSRKVFWTNILPIDTRRGRVSRQLKSLKINEFSKNSSTESDSLCRLITEIESLSSLYHVEYQSKHALCTLLWSSVDGRDWALHAQSRHGIDKNFPNAIKALADSLNKHETPSLSKKINTEVNFHCCTEPG